MIVRVCPKHGRHPAGQPCPSCAAADTTRRNTLNRQQGRTTQHWKRIAAAAKQAHPFCADCTSTLDLTVHLHPSLGGNHRLATLDTVTVLCRSCHGQRDAPRAAEARRGAVQAEKPLAYPEPVIREKDFSDCKKESCCLACGSPLARTGKRGRPRKFCTACVPPGKGKDAIRAWRAASPERVEAYNASRRVAK